MFLLRTSLCAYWGLSNLIFTISLLTLSCRSPLMTSFQLFDFHRIFPYPFPFLLCTSVPILPLPSLTIGIRLSISLWYPPRHFSFLSFFHFESSASQICSAAQVHIECSFCGRSEWNESESEKKRAPVKNREGREREDREHKIKSKIVQKRW
jgi:hypothetical protein